MNTPQALIFFGPQGSGKGTQLENTVRLFSSREIPVTTIQTGEVFRSLANSDTPAAKQVGACLAEGKFVPTSVTNTLVIQALLDRWTPEHRVLFDGYPRTLAQAKTLIEVLEFFSCDGIAVLHLDTPDAVVEERMVERGRLDDTPELVAKRLALYHEETQPVLDFLATQPSVAVHTIDGAQDIAAVEKAIASILFS